MLLPTRAYFSLTLTFAIQRQNDSTEKPSENDYEFGGYRTLMNATKWLSLICSLMTSFKLSFYFTRFKTNKTMLALISGLTANVVNSLVY